MSLKLLPWIKALPRLLIALVLAMGGLLLQPPVTGSAHAVLVRADPVPLSTLTRPPDRVTMWMSEPLNARFSSIQVFDSQRQRVDMGNSRVASEDSRRMEVGLRPLKDGTYTVLWAANSQFDGHALRGTYSFTVNLSGSPVLAQEGVAQRGIPSTDGTVGVWTSATVVHTAAQWIALLTVLLIVGSLLFRIFVPGVLKLQGKVDLARMLAQWDVPKYRKMERLFAFTLPISTIGATLATLASAGGSWVSAFSPSLIRDFISGSPIGIAIFIKIIMALIVAGILFDRSSKYQALGASLLFLVSVAFTGHARAVDQPLLVPITLDWVHLVAASAWFGGMVFVATALLPSRKSKKRGFSTWQQVILVLDGFFPIALTSVGLLLATGFYNSATRLSSPGNLFSSSFGLVLFIKLIAVAVMLIMGYLNAFIIRPRLKIAYQKQPGDQISLVSRLRRILVWEPAFGIIAVMVTAILAAYPPPGLALRTPTPQSPIATSQAPASASTDVPRFSLAQKAEDVVVILKVGPGDVGKNRLSVSVAGAKDGSPLSVAALVRLRATFLEQESGSQFITTETQPDGSYAGVADFTFKGAWKIEVIVRRQDKADVTTSFNMAIPATDATALLARADKAMNGLKSLALHEELDDAAGPIQATDVEFQAPDRTHLRDQRGFEIYLIGINQFFKEPGGKWQRGTGLGRLAYSWSDLGFGRGWEQPVIVGSERLEGQPHSIVTAFDSQSGLYYLLWIGTDDNRIRRWKHIGPGHFIDSRFSGFNSTTIPVAESELPK